MSWLCKSCMGGACEGCNPDDPAMSNYHSMLAKRGSAFQDASVLCPFYRRVAKKQKMTICEGPMEQTVTTTFYHSREQMIEHVKKYCEGDYKSCRIFKIVNEEKYEGG